VKSGDAIEEPRPPSKDAVEPGPKAEPQHPESEPVVGVALHHIDEEPEELVLLLGAPLWRCEKGHHVRWRVEDVERGVEATEGFELLGRTKLLNGAEQALSDLTPGGTHDAVSFPGRRQCARRGRSRASNALGGW